MIPTVKDIANLRVDQLPPLVHVPPVTGPFDITVRPPGSKSLTNRALLLAALADGESVLTGALADADDAQVMIRALRQLGTEIDVTPEVEPNGESCGNATIRVKGVAGRWKIPAGQTITLNLNNAGTATRFLTAAAVLQPPESGGIIIDGNARMRERPISELTELLRRLGARVEELGARGCVPLRIEPLADLSRLTRELLVPTTASSQFISALMLAAPFLPNGLALRWDGPVTSWPYIKMTEGVLRDVQVEAEDDHGHVMHIRRTWAGSHGLKTSGLHAFRLAIEPDASGATYAFAAAAIVAGSRCRIHGLDLGSLQGDTRFLGVLAATGANAQAHGSPAFVVAADRISAFEASMGDMPDTAMTAAVVACFADDPSTLTGLRTLRVKETDRVEALVNELTKVGVSVEPFSLVGAYGRQDEGIRITPPPNGIDCSLSAPPVEFDTYDDHRMAMSLALIGLRRPNVYIRDPGCVRKTYPTFWRDLAKVYG